jgi:ligand-binding sensor domain-containing protein
MGLSSQTIYDIFRDDEDRIWIGCDKGLSEISIPSWRVTTYNENDGLEGAKVCKILKGEDNRLWLSTINGISSIDMQSGEIINTHGQERRYPSGEFFIKSGSLLSDGRLVFSGNNGLEIFNPSDITTNPNVPG